MKHNGCGLPLPACRTTQRAASTKQRGEGWGEGEPLGRTFPTTAHRVKLEGLRQTLAYFVQANLAGRKAHVQAARPSPKPLPAAYLMRSATSWGRGERGPQPFCYAVRPRCVHPLDLIAVPPRSAPTRQGAISRPPRSRDRGYSREQRIATLLTSALPAALPAPSLACAIPRSAAAPHKTRARTAPPGRWKRSSR